MKRKVFISGPILGMENDQGYREIITAACVRLGFEVIDPWLREKILYKGDERCWWTKCVPMDFVQRDLDDADRCDVIVVYLAKRKGKKVIVVSGMECLSPWIVMHSDAIVKSFADLEDALKQF